MLGGWGGNRVGLVESNGFGHQRADCRGPESAQESYARFNYGTTYDRSPTDFTTGLLHCGLNK